MNMVHGEANDGTDQAEDFTDMEDLQQAVNDLVLEETVPEVSSSSHLSQPIQSFNPSTPSRHQLQDTSILAPTPITTSSGVHGQTYFDNIVPNNPSSNNSLGKS